MSVAPAVEGRLTGSAYLRSYQLYSLSVAEPGKFINLNFDSFATECDYDFLYVYDGESCSSRLIGAFSGTTLPDVISASSGHVSVNNQSTSLLLCKCYSNEKLIIFIGAL